MQQRLQTTPERNALIKIKHLTNNCKPGEMLRGLPLSKELRRWSGHSGSSSASSSSASGTSYGCTSSCSSGSSGMTTGFSVCDPVWCNVRKRLCNRCIEWDEYNGYIFECKVVNIIQEHILQAHVIYCILFYYYCAKSTHLIICFKDTPKLH